MLLSSKNTLSTEASQAPQQRRVAAFVAWQQGAGHGQDDCSELGEGLFCDIMGKVTKLGRVGW